MVGHDTTEEFCCSVIYQNAAVVETKRLGASDFTLTQLADVTEKMYAKIGGAGTGLRGIQLSTNYGRHLSISQWTEEMYKGEKWVITIAQIVWTF